MMLVTKAIIEDVIRREIAGAEPFAKDTDVVMLTSRIIDALSDAGFVLVPAIATEKMVDAGLMATAAWLRIPGSQLTQNREKMRRRYIAMLAAVAPEGEDDGDP